MRRIRVASFFLIVLSLPFSILAQEKPSTPAQQRPSVAPDAAVITVVASCRNSAPQATPQECTAQVSRAQFESIASVVSPTAAASTQDVFAKRYGEILGLASLARRQGLENTDAYRQMLEVAKANLLAQLFLRETQKDAQQVPETEIESYYRDHQADFQQANLQRLRVPRHAAAAGQAGEDDHAYAEKIRERWIAGEVPEKLQQEAYEHAENKGSAPPVDLGLRRKNSLPPAQQTLFSLKDGEVSQPAPDPSAFMLYKLSKKQTLPLAEVKEEIVRTMATQRYQEALQKLNSEIVVKIDPAYFSSTPPEPGPGQRPNPLPQK